MKLKRIFITLLVVVLMIFTLVLPATAADQEIKVQVKAEVKTSFSVTSGNISLAEHISEASKIARVTTDIIYGPEYFMSAGMIPYNGHSFTWYSQKVLPGQLLCIPGRHVNELGYICDGDGYICLASCDYPHGTVLDTPFGRKGKVYDECPVSGLLDVYVSW